MIERKALPAPPLGQIPDNLEDALKTTLTEIESIQEEITQKQFELEQRIGEAQIFAAESRCGRFDDKQNVEQYDGTLGVSKEFVAAYEKPIGQIQWSKNIGSLFNAPNDDPGNVEGER